jgi:hypothetical protein
MSVAMKHAEIDGQHATHEEQKQGPRPELHDIHGSLSPLDGLG